MINRTYNKLSSLETFDERYEYLKLQAGVGEPTFGFERYLNQELYKSKEWKTTRRNVIVRDEGCDLGVKDRKIQGQIIVHHLNPISVEDIVNHSSKLFDMNNLVCSSKETHNAVHYGASSLLSKLPEERKKGDTCPWIVS